MGRWAPMHNWPQWKEREFGLYTLRVWSGWDEAGVGIVLGNEVLPGWEVAALDVDTDDLDDGDRVYGAVQHSTIEKRGRRGQTGFYLVPAGTVGRRLKRGKETIFELLTGTATRQTVIPPSVHPDTGMPYRWLTSRTLANTPATDLPRLSADDIERLMDSFCDLEGVEVARAPRVDPGEAYVGAGRPFEAVKTAALENLQAWVPQLGLYRCKRTAEGYEAVPTWRAGGTGRSDDQRKRSLGIHRTGIKDFGVDQGFNAIGLVMQARGLDFGDAYTWLEDQLGLTPEPWVDFPLGKSARARPDSEEPYGEVAEPEAVLEIDAAREAVERIIQAHIRAGQGDRAIRVATGVGKTSIAVRLIADEVRRLRAAGNKTSRVLFAVPTHKLGAEVVLQFERHGVTAKVFRGRGANNPDGDGKMCGDLEIVNIALGLGYRVSTSCCDGENPKTGTKVRCRLLDNCAYQRQTDELPDVWIASHQLLFMGQSSMGRVAAVFVDEGFWQNGSWPATRGLSLDELGAEPKIATARFDDTACDLSVLRAKLARALLRQGALGGIERRHLVEEGLTVDECTEARKAEWALAEPATMYPGMPSAARRKAASIAAGIKHIKARDAVWCAARALLKHSEGAKSGCLFLAEVNTKEAGRIRVIKTRGIKAIAEQWQVSTMLMDATLPGLPILTAFYPNVNIVADIEAAAPHAHLRQVVGAPVSASKLKGKGERNLRSVRRALIHRHVAYGRERTLVIAQMAVANWLKEAGMPPGVSVEHYNNVAGLDVHKNVRLLIAVGRTMPSVEDAEGHAGALIGLEDARISEPTAKGQRRWYNMTMGTIRLKDGRTHSINVERHPGPTTERLCSASSV